MLADDYVNAGVRGRMLEFLGGTSLNDTTAAYITAPVTRRRKRLRVKPLTPNWRPRLRD
jgi:hypothetical protein